MPKKTVRKKRTHTQKTYRTKHNDEVIITESHLEKAFLTGWLKQYPNAPPVTQHIFHPTRLWRFDFYWPSYKLAVEVQGYGPGHCSKVGMLNDADKSNAALTQGIITVFLTEHHVRNQNIQRTCKLIAYIMSKR